MTQTQILRIVLYPILIILLVLGSQPAAADTVPTIWEVTNTEDYGATDPVVPGSLRWAMTQANSDGTRSRITFNIDTSSDPGCTFGGPCTIAPERALPFLNAGSTEIDGYTQPGALEAVGSGFATIQIEVDGHHVTGNNGFNITSAENEIRGLAINRFGYWGVAIYNPAADNNTVAGNYIGTDVTGLVCTGMGNGYSGVGIENGAGDNTIGGTASADRNIISCNHLNGVDISDLANSGSTSGNQVLGNIIGDPDMGGVTQGNVGAGVFIGYGAFDNTVGGSISGTRNLINHNGGDGVWLNGPNTTGNVIAGNYIGVNGDASVEMHNFGYGVNINGGAHGNSVGGPTQAYRNVISGSLSGGVRIAGPSTHHNEVLRNYIGINAAGTASVGNSGGGVILGDGAWANTIGPLNVISGNNGPGVLFGSGATLNAVVTNFIGTDPGGVSALMNSYGVRIEDGANANLIGGLTLGEANLISGNDYDGVVITGSGTDSNYVLNNSIGTTYPATAALPNGNGVTITDGAQTNHVGQAGAGNLISGNKMNGVGIYGLGTDGNVVAGNTIGLDGTGVLPLPNQMTGVSVSLGASDNIIGGASPGSGNLISGNASHGVGITGDDSVGNAISGNYIGLDPGGTTAIPNGGDGVHLSDGAYATIIGGSSLGERNVISGNAAYGVFLEDPGTDQNEIAGNYIGTNAAGDGAVPNGSSGISLYGGPAFNTIGGDGSGEGNLISGNDGNGIYLVLAGTESNTITGNIIGLNADGSAAIPNGTNGIFLQMSADNNTIGGPSAPERNIISGNGERGIRISDCSGVVIQGNLIGTGIDGIAAVGNTYQGVQLVNDTTGVTIGPGNRIAHNGFEGVSVSGAGTIGNTITRSLIFSNGLYAINLVDGANGAIMPAYITAVTLDPITISGTACGGCTAEVFANPVNEDEGRIFLGGAVANGSGDWSLTVGSIPAPYLTATATDAVDGTSMFSYTYFSDVLSVFLPLIMR